jgi:hypothetical protein
MSYWDFFLFIGDKKPVTVLAKYKISGENPSFPRVHPYRPYVDSTRALSFRKLSRYGGLITILLELYIGRHEPMWSEHLETTLDRSRFTFRGSSLPTTLSLAV